MTVPTNTILLVKTVTGRLLLDTDKAGCPFRLEGGDGAWTLTVQGVAPGTAAEIRSLVSELNLFYFEDYGSAASRRKWWLYDSACPQHQYDESSLALTLQVDRRIGYSNEHTGTS
ncbi:hypothetical protein O9H85_14010 [Paenibacillus filicis]|uniref:Uncharacterized protein n=1 Tax=Paenibacillus gyeongsangnamensis TaxID=3388067 RepID=A0ABT4Q9H0_9BACL|nr:hypothetical protein [Paenibacillus filicis]MCZ8513528.1 hypothetical protein [Paenibacillus filicis]